MAVGEPGFLGEYVQYLDPGDPARPTARDSFWAGEGKCSHAEVIWPQGRSMP
jgi:hypothetical protein